MDSVEETYKTRPHAALQNEWSESLSILWFTNNQVEQIGLKCDI